ncbi:MAG: membrane dipeptidase [Anaerolineae bacterium]
MIVVDAHQDIAYWVMQYGRDYTRSAWATRRLEARSGASRLHGVAANGLPDALLGRIALIFTTLFVEPAWSTFTPQKQFGYVTPDEAYRQALRQWDYYQRLFEDCPQVTPVRTAEELDAVLETWAPGTDLADHRIGLVLLMEGADPVLEPRQLEEWVARGVRIVGPAWSQTRYAGGSWRPGPLTDLGRELLEVMADFNLILDLSHMTEEGYFEALDRYPGPVIASHSNPTRFWDDHRNLTDRQIAALAERDGVMGIVLYNRYMNAGWYRGAPKTSTPFETVIDMIDHVCQVTGSVAHVGIGSDIDGGFGAEAIPDGIDTVTDFLRIADGLRARGFSAADTEAVMSGNFLRVLRRSLP